MGRRSSKRDKQRYWGARTWVSVPREVLRSQAYISLSAYAQKLLFDLLSQHNGKNNGDLCTAWSVMSKRGWRSAGTLWKAKKELEAKEFIIVTRQGGRNKATLYAITFFRIDPCNGKLDDKISDASYPMDEWKKHDGKN